MNAVLKITLIALAAYSVGTIAGPMAITAIATAKDILSPFMILSAAVLIGSIGYAIGAIRRFPLHAKGRERDPYDD